MNRRINLQRAYILHSRAYRDTSLIMELFTPDYGRISCIGRGVRGTKPRYGGILQLFYPLVVSLVGRSELLTLTFAEPDKLPLSICGSVVFSAWYINELLVRILHKHDPHPDLFLSYDQALHHLGSESDVQVGLRLFELSLLRSLGYGLRLDVEANCKEPIDADGHYHYIHHKGFLRQSNPESQPCYAGSSLLALQRGELITAEQKRDAKHLLRTALQDLLGDKPVRTRELLKVYSSQ